MLDHRNTAVRGRDVAAAGKRGGGRLGRFTQKASLVEYGLLLAAIIAVVVLVVFALGSYVTSAFTPASCSGSASAAATSTTSCPSH